MDEIQRILLNAGLKNNKILNESLEINENAKMSLDDAKFIIKASRDWLDRKNQLENFKTTGDYDADYQRKENIEEEMAHIRGILEEDKARFGFRRVSDMFQHAKDMVKGQSESKGIEETAYDADLDPNRPIKVQGIRGLQSKDFTKRFRNMAAYEKWLEKHGDNVEVNYIMNEQLDDQDEDLDEAFNKFKEELAFEEFKQALEAAGVGIYDPRSNKTADVGPNTLRKMAARFGNKVSKGGIPPRVSKNSFVKEEGNDQVSDEEIWSLLSNKMTATTGPEDAHELAYYIISPKKVAVQYPDNIGIPEAILAGPSWEKLNMTKDEFVQWLENQGVKKIKKPRPIKSSLPYYD